MNIKSVVAVALIGGLCWPVFSWCQGMPAMDPAAMQKMMQIATEMSNCMQQVDQQALNQLQQRTMDFDSKAKVLCAQGKVSQAQQLAMDFARELSSSATVKQITKCSEPMQDSMKAMMPPMPDYPQKIEELHQSVCDTYNVRQP